MAVKDKKPRGARSPKVAPEPRAHPVGPAESRITPDRIRFRAYEIFLARRGARGDAASDWAQAERELLGGGTPATPESMDPPAVGA